MFCRLDVDGLLPSTFSPPLQHQFMLNFSISFGFDTSDFVTFNVALVRGSGISDGIYLSDLTRTE